MSIIKKPLPLTAAALTTVAVLAASVAGCGGDSSSSSSSSPSRTASTTASANATDAAFVNDMIPHHQAAIDMAKVAQTRAEHPQVRALAAGIVAAQRSEIAEMRAMRTQMTGMGMRTDGHMGMDDDDMGMADDMTSLDTATPFDRAFIDMMIPHHEGAIRMARKELADGERPGLRTMAQAIVKAQSAEIARMRAWRTQWYGGSGTPSTTTTEGGMHDGMAHGG